MKMKLLKTFVSGILFLASLAHAAEVTNVKEKRVLLDTTGLEALEGDEFFLMTIENKKVGIVKLTKVKNGKALGDLIKGRAEIGMTLMAKSNTPKAAPRSTKNTFDPTDESSIAPSLKGNTGFKLKRANVGILFNVLMNTMSAEEQNGNGVAETAAMKGTSFGAMGFYDYAFSPRLMVRGAAGLDMYSTSSSITILGCENKTSTSCNVNINYLTASAYGKYNLTVDGNTRFFLLGGTSLMYAVSKKSTALKESEISITQVFLFGGGVDIKMDEKTFIPISIEYGIFPPSDSVKASTIYIRGGYAWIF